MSEFKVGDTIRRVKAGNPWSPMGYEAEVVSVDENGPQYLDKTGAREYAVPDHWEHAGPVRTETVTKRRIVPGVYGRLRVGDCYGAGVWVEVTEGKGGSLVLTATELDDLAMVASQLAEALRDVD